MIRRNRAIPGPAMVVAVLALVAAVAGTAVAGPNATTSAQKKLSKKQKKQTKKIANKQADKAIESTLPIGAEELGSISEESDTATVNTGTTGTAEASCGERKVISGGWKDNNTPTETQAAVVYEDHRTNDGWKASVIALGTNRTITAYAYCLDL